MPFFRILSLGLFLVGVGLQAQQCPDYLSHHVVGSRAIVPGVYFLRQALETARATKMAAGEGSAGVVGISSFLIRKPMVYTRQAQVACSLDAKGRLQCTNPEDGIVHARGKIAEDPQIPQFTTPEWPLASYVESLDLYYFLMERGLFYGEFFRRLSGIVDLQNEYALARLNLHPGFQASVVGAAPPDSIHPSILDSALHALAAFAMRDERALSVREVAVPVLFENVYWDSSVVSGGKYSVAVRRMPVQPGDKQIVYDLILRNEAEQILFAIQRGVLQLVSAASLSGI